MKLTDVDERAIVRFLPGDVLAVLLFVLLGTMRHGSLTAERYAGVLLPFLVGWLAVAPLAGAYARRATESTRAALVVAASTWLGATLVGSLLRATSLFPGNADPTFFLVTFLLGGAILAAFRFGTLVVVDLRGN